MLKKTIVKKLLLPTLLAALPALLIPDASAIDPRTGSKPRDKARVLVLDGAYADAIAAYNPLARASRDASLAAEYAYALALAGNTELALAHLDRAFLTDANNPEVLFFASKIFDALGVTDAAAELARSAPDWLDGGGAKPAIKLKPAKDLGESLSAANSLIGQRRFASAAERFAGIVRKYPDEQMSWAGYAIALEKLGAFKTAAKAVAKDLELGKKEDEETRKLLAAHKAELAARGPVEPEPVKLNKMLKGRYLAFFGLNYTHTGEVSILNLNTRVGKFLTNRIDVGASAGYTSGYDNSDYNGLSLGLSGRYSQPLPLSMPLNATAGARLQYQPGPEDNFATVLSPGLSYVLANGSLDLFLDFALSGPQKGTQTLSLGYTIYFGGARK